MASTDKIDVSASKEDYPSMIVFEQKLLLLKKNPHLPTEVCPCMVCKPRKTLDCKNWELANNFFGHICLLPQLDRYGIRLIYNNVVVMNYSNTVGSPRRGRLRRRH